MDNQVLCFGSEQHHKHTIHGTCWETSQEYSGTVGEISPYFGIKKTNKTNKNFQHALYYIGNLNKTKYNNIEASAEFEIRKIRSSENHLNQNIKKII